MFTGKPTTSLGLPIFKPDDHPDFLTDFNISIHAPARGATANIAHFFYTRVPFLSNIHKFQHFLTIQI